MTHIFGLLVHLDPVLAKFDGQGHKRKNTAKVFGATLRVGFSGLSTDPIFVELCRIMNALLVTCCCMSSHLYDVRYNGYPAMQKKAQ